MNATLQTQGKVSPRLSAGSARTGILQRKCACGRTPGLDGECAECRNKRLTMQRRPTNLAEPSTVPPIVYEVLRSPGQPLDPATRAFMEPRFGHDFSQVRVHADAKAAESARAVNALAYTLGRDVVFGNEQYSPGTSEGRRLLAHELVHVVQQWAALPGGKEHLMLSKPEDACEREADAVGSQVISDHRHLSSAPASRVAHTAAASLMRTPDNDKPVPKTCDPPQGPGKHPETVSQTIIDRWIGKHAREGDPGEGCREEPYVAGKNEKVCTVGFGHQVRDCPVLSRATGEAPTPEEISKAGPSEPPEFKCACEGTVRFDCKGGQAEAQVRTDARGAIEHIHKVVPVDLDQAQFDALVDISLHRGSMPPDLSEAIKKYWCTDAGKDYVRDIYLKTALEPFPEAFAKRRKFRVWPPSSEKKVKVAPVEEKNKAPKKKVTPERPESKPKPQIGGPPSLLPAPELPPPSLLPGAPGPDPVHEAAQVVVPNLRSWADRLVRRGTALADRIHSAEPPRTEERQKFAEAEKTWRFSVEYAIREFKKQSREYVVEELSELLYRQGGKLQEIRTLLVG
jgi:GH24 family phage-related lysozyme (muramidase)